MVVFALARISEEHSLDVDFGVYAEELNISCHFQP